jgi:DNA modification methylase
MWTDKNRAASGWPGGVGMMHIQKIIIDNATLYQGDCIETMRGMVDNCVDSIVCDPPYLLGFMGKKWDAADGIAGKSDVWSEALRILKPGGHLLAFGAPRTNHRMVTAIEDAGFEIRDSIQWIFGSGFPKSMDVSKAIDRAAGAECTEFVKSSDPRYKSGSKKTFLENKGGAGTLGKYLPSFEHSQPKTGEAKQWQGWGTALKPAFEPICVARKPLDKSTVAANVLAWGTGGINIDGCRVSSGMDYQNAGWGERFSLSSGQRASGDSRPWSDAAYVNGEPIKNSLPSELGRWPANLIHDGSPEVLAVFPETTSGAQKPHINKSVAKNTVASFSSGLYGCLMDYTAPASKGSAARFFYTAKASKSDRDNGLDSICTVKYNILKGELLFDLQSAVTLLQKATQDIPMVRWLIGESGENITGLCPSGFLSTTLMALKKITTSEIWSLSQHSRTSGFIQDVSLEMANGGSRVEGVENLSKSMYQTGICQKKDGHSTDDANHAILKLLSWINDGENWIPGKNIHSTVKPTDLMAYLCRLVTPPGGTVLDIFMGSGSTGKAATLEGFSFIGIEREAEYFEIAQARIKRASAQKNLF